MEYLDKVRDRLGHAVQHFNLDGNIHRFNKEDKPNNKDLWAVGNTWFFNGHTYWRVYCGDWSAPGRPHEITSWSKNHAPLSSEAREEAAKQQQALEMRIHEQQLLNEKRCIKRSIEQIDKAKINEDHPYLDLKGIKSHDSYISEEGHLLIPIVNIKDEIKGLQKIIYDHDTDEFIKRYESGFQKRGKFISFGELDEDKAIYICEGFATGASIYESLGEDFAVLCSLDAHNIKNVVAEVRRAGFENVIVICADRDKVAVKQGYRTGQFYAESVAASFSNVLIRYPYDNEDQLGDFNDLHKTDGLDAVKDRLVICDDSRDETFDVAIEAGFSSFTQKGRLVRNYDMLWQYFSHKYNYKYVPEIRSVFVWNGKKYKQWPDAMIKSFVQDHFKPICEKEHERMEFLKLVQTRNVCRIEDLSADEGKLISFDNGVYNIESMKLEPHSPEVMLTKAIPHSYRADALCPTFDKLLWNLFEDHDLCDLVYEMIGLILSGCDYTKYQKVFIMFGGGFNGKSTIISIIKDLIGERNATGVQVSEISGNRFLTSELNRGLVNVSEEENKRCFRDTGVLKRLTGNSLIFTEQKTKGGVSAVNKSKFIMSYNEMPFINDLSDGMRRRLMIIPFKFNLGDRPEKLIDNVFQVVKVDYQGIIRKALIAFAKLEAIGRFSGQDICNDQFESLLVNGNDIYGWYHENVDKSDPDAKTPVHELLEDYYNETGDKSLRVKRLGLYLAKQGHLKSRSRLVQGGNLVTVYHGVRIC